MRIDQIQSQQAVQESKETKSPGSGGPDDTFALLLQNEIAGQGQEIAPNASVYAPINVADLGALSLSGNPAQASELSLAISAVNGAITQLDSLRDALQTNQSPKQINALIEQLNAGLVGMYDKTSALPAGHELNNMAEELKVMGYMESVKWRRGDYL